VIFVVDGIAQQGLKTKDRSGHQIGRRFRERFGSGPCEPRTSGLSPDPPWPLPARLAEPAFEGRFVPDASEMMEFAAVPSRVFFGIAPGVPQLVAHQFEKYAKEPPA
jgi:hypothetical protein